MAQEHNGVVIRKAKNVHLNYNLKPWMVHARVSVDPNLANGINLHSYITIVTLNSQMPQHQQVSKNIKPWSADKTMLLLCTMQEFLTGVF